MSILMTRKKEQKFKIKKNRTIVIKGSLPEEIFMAEELWDGSSTREW